MPGSPPRPASVPAGVVAAATDGVAAPPAARPSLVWGFDFVGGDARPVAEAALALGAGAGGIAGPEGSGFRWLHLSITDQSNCRWIAGLGALPEGVREVLLSPDTHQRALVLEGFVACVLHDVEVDFGKAEASRMGALRFACHARGMLTARHHPLHAAEVVKRRIDAGFRPDGPAPALDLLVGSIAAVASRTSLELTASVEGSEDALLEDGWAPDPRRLAAIRRQAVRLHRQLGGMRGVLGRLEEAEDLPEPLLPTVVKLSQRVAALDADVLATQGDLRLLRDELDLQATQRTNRNLYVLSILSALLLPATLVTGFFGMNTGGFPWGDTPWGTALAGCLAAGSSFAVYVWLRRRGFLGGS